MLRTCSATPKVSTTSTPSLHHPLVHVPMKPALPAGGLVLPYSATGALLPFRPSPTFSNSAMISRQYRGWVADESPYSVSLCFFVRAARSLPSISFTSRDFLFFSSLFFNAHEQ